MPKKINMIISNNNNMSLFQQKQLNNALVTPVVSKPSSALNSPFIARIHNAKSGCGSCGR